MVYAWKRHKSVAHVQHINGRKSAQFKCENTFGRKRERSHTHTHSGTFNARTTQFRIYSKRIQIKVIIHIYICNELFPDKTTVRIRNGILIENKTFSKQIFIRLHIYIGCDINGMLEYWISIPMFKRYQMLIWCHSFRQCNETFMPMLMDNGQKIF